MLQQQQQWQEQQARVHREDREAQKEQMTQLLGMMTQMVADQGARQEQLLLSHVSSLRAELHLPPVATLSLPTTSVAPLAQHTVPLQTSATPPSSPQVYFNYQSLMGSVSLSPIYLPFDTPTI